MRLGLKARVISSEGIYGGITVRWRQSEWRRVQPACLQGGRWLRCGRAGTHGRLRQSDRAAVESGKDITKKGALA